MKNKISPEDREVLKTLSILQTTIGGLMATLADLQTKIADLKTAQDGLNTKIATFETEVVNAFNRLEAKIAAGTDTQPAIDALAPIAQSISDKSSELDTKIAEAQTTGV